MSDAPIRDRRCGQCGHPINHHGPNRCAFTECACAIPRAELDAQLYAQMPRACARVVHVPFTATLRIEFYEPPLYARANYVVLPIEEARALRSQIDDALTLFDHAQALRGDDL
jgi:hypothetical protein